MKILTTVSPVTNTIAAVVSKWKVFCVQTAKDFLKGLTDYQFQFRRETVHFQFRTYSSRTVTAATTVKNQNVSHWFICYKSVK
jgi:hypothetical protein